MKTPATVTRAATSGPKQSFLHDFAPSVYNKYQRGILDAKRDSKYRPATRTQNEANNLYFFLRSNLEVRSSRYWSPPSLSSSSQFITNPVTSSSVGVDSYFQQTDGDASFISTPFWFRLKNRKDFYTYDEFVSVLLAEAYWEQQLAKIVAFPTHPLTKRKGWSNWTRISVKDKASAPANSVPAAPVAAALSKTKKNNLMFLSEGEGSDLVALRRPFRQRFFALFRAATEDYNGDLLIEDWAKDRVAELKVGLKLWANPFALIAHGASVPNTAEALKAHFPAGTLNRFGFVPSALQYLGYGGLHQSQFPLPYNLYGKLHLHPNVVTALQYQYNLDLSSPGAVFHTHNSWQPVNERRVGNTSAGYQTDAAYGAKFDTKDSSVKIPGFENSGRVESTNAVISSLWTYFLRRRFYSLRPSETDTDLASNEIGLAIYRRRDEVPFGTIRVNLFKRRTWKQLYASGNSSVSKIWALRPQTRGLELTEDLLSGAGGFHNYFTNVDKKVSGFNDVVVKGF